MSTSSILKYTSVPFSQMEKTSISGKYRNNTSSQGRSLWDLLCMSQKKCRNQNVSDSAVISLRKEQSGNYTATLTDGNIEIQSIEIEGRLKENYFSIKRRLRWIPIPFLYFQHHERKLLMGLTENNNLLIKEGGIEFLWIIRAGGPQPWREDYVFEKISKD